MDSSVTLNDHGQKDQSELGQLLEGVHYTYCDVDRELPSDPLKLYESLALNIPVISSYSPSLDFVEENNFGFLFREESRGEMRRFLSICSANRFKPIEGRSYIKEHNTWKSLLSRMLRTMNSANES